MIGSNEQSGASVEKIDKISKGLGSPTINPFHIEFTTSLPRDIFSKRGESLKEGVK